MLMVHLVSCEANSFHSCNISIQMRGGSCRVGCVKRNACTQVQSLRLMAMWNLTCGNCRNSLTVHFSNLAERYLVVIMSQLGVASRERVEEQIMNDPYDLLSFSASSVRSLICPTARTKAPQSSFRPVSMRKDKERALPLWSVFSPSCPGPTSCPADQTVTVRAARTHNQRSTFGDPCSHQSRPPLEECCWWEFLIFPGPVRPQIWQCGVNTSWHHRLATDIRNAAAFLCHVDFGQKGLRLQRPQRPVNKPGPWQEEMEPPRRGRLIVGELSGRWQAAEGKVKRQMFFSQTSSI